MKLHEWQVIALLFVLICLSASEAIYAQAGLIAPGSLPQIPTNTIIPTDVTGIGGNLGYAQGLRRLILGPDRNTVPANHGLIVARDPRYNFAGNSKRWTPLVPEQIAFATKSAATTAGLWQSLIISQPAVIASPTGTAVQSGIAPLVLPLSPLLDSGYAPAAAMLQIMPAAGTQVNVSGAEELTLTNGALLIKTGLKPIYVRIPLAAHSANIFLPKGTITMVALVGGHLTVANLHDTAANSAVIYLSNNNGASLGLERAVVRLGQLAEIYPNNGNAESKLVSYAVLYRTALSSGYNVEIMRFSYPRLMKRFNITCSLPQADLQQIIKSAAAISYIDSQR